MKKSNSHTWLIVTVAAIIVIAGIFYWRKTGAQCHQICTVNNEGMTECTAACAPGTAPEVVAAAETAAEAAQMPTV